MKLCLEGTCIEASTEGNDPYCLAGGVAEVSAALQCLLRLAPPVHKQMLRIILLDYYALCSPLTGVISVNKGPLEGLLLPKGCSIEYIDEKEDGLEAITSCGIKVACRIARRAQAAGLPIDENAVESPAWQRR